MLLIRESLVAIANEFDLGGGVAAIAEYGSGKINDTYLVTLVSGERRILQRLNPHVFPAPKQVMSNLRIITEHMAGRVESVLTAAERWEIPRIYRTRAGQDFSIDREGGVWRCMGYIGNATAFIKVQNHYHAREAGAALGRFHQLLSDLDPGRLYDTLPGFHITPGYLNRYDQVIAKCGPLPEETQALVRFIAARRDIAYLLEERKTAQTLKLRIMHGDPKLNNIMIDDRTGQAVALIDLDTVKPGLIQYDIGDLLRSACNPAGGDALDVNAVRFDVDLYRAILTGYLTHARACVSELDLQAIPDSVLIIAFELGLRYFTDFLEGSVYFKAATPVQNLNRASVQFRLVERIEEAKQQLAGIIDEIN